MSDDVTNLAEVLADHFIMWRELSRLSGPPGEWVCQCGLKFGYSDTAIDHVAEQIAPLIAEARLIGAAMAHTDAIAAYAELVERVEALLAAAKRRDAMSLSCDFNGNRWESSITQAELRALIDPEATS